MDWGLTSRGRSSLLRRSDSQRYSRLYPSVLQSAHSRLTATRTEVGLAVVVAAAAGRPVASGMWTAHPLPYFGMSFPAAAAAAVVLVPAAGLQVLVGPTYMDCERHYWQLVTPLVLAPCTPGAGRGVDCTTPRLGMPWYLLAARGRDRHRAAWGRPKNQMKTIEGYVHLANHQRGVR